MFKTVFIHVLNVLLFMLWICLKFLICNLLHKKSMVIYILLLLIHSSISIRIRNLCHVITGLLDYMYFIEVLSHTHTHTMTDSILLPFFYFYILSYYILVAILARMHIK